MKTGNAEFEARKRVVLAAAKKQGIVDVVSASDNTISLEAVELATKLMKKHGPSIQESLEKRRKAQK
jgi:hypothetical protein